MNDKRKQRPTQQNKLGLHYKTGTGMRDKENKQGLHKKGIHNKKIKD